MRFLTFDKANAQPYRKEFRYTLFWPSVLAGFSTGISVASIIGVVRMWGENWIGVFMFGWLALWFFIFALIARSLLRARMRPSRWLVRLQPDGLLVKFRSYLNYHFSQDDPIVVHTPYSEIEWIRQHRVIRNIPGATGGDDTTTRQKYAELKVRRELVEELERYLGEERSRKGPTRPKWMGNGYSFSRHYPVQTIAGELIRIEWGVRPRIKDFLSEIGTFVAVREIEKSAVDFRTVENLPKAEQEQRLLELIESGDRMDAIRVARLLYKFDLTEAVKFIDQLGGKSQSD